MTSDRWLRVGFVLMTMAVIGLSATCRYGFYQECRRTGGSVSYCAHVATAR